MQPNRWVRYGLPLIPAMVVGMVAMVLIGFPTPKVSTGLYQPSPDSTWVAIVLGLFVATYIVGVVILWWRSQ